MARKYANALYRVEVTRTGDVLAEFRTYRDAMNYVKRMQRKDMRIDGEPFEFGYSISRFQSPQYYYQEIWNTKYGAVADRPRRKVKKKKSDTTGFGFPKPKKDSWPNVKV